ncbi:IS5 family transposase, partial [Geminicoccus flavidas]|uniref:IS5 family transposase n=1 Tax=Geminicoccus flavidas TaxID=2506407 RepID=UPI0013581E7F
MTIRTLLTDVMWTRLEPLLPPQKPRTGRPSIDHRRFIEAVLWLARTGSPWRDLPAELMNWRTAWRRLQRWTQAGIWSRILGGLRGLAADAGWQLHMLDSTVIRAHAHAAGARRSAGEQALGRSRGGFSTKLHLRANAHGRPVALHLTGGERH